MNDARRRQKTASGARPRGLQAVDFLVCRQRLIIEDLVDQNRFGAGVDLFDANAAVSSTKVTSVPDNVELAAQSSTGRQLMNALQP